MEFYLDLLIVFAVCIWIATIKIKLVRMMPCIRWAYRSDVSNILHRSRFKTTLTLVFSLLCIIFFAIRFYLVLRAISADSLVCFTLPILLSIYGVYVVFFCTLYSAINEELSLQYKQYMRALGLPQ